jgi:glycosyltransferase involved in cell wall biosynthesis
VLSFARCLDPAHYEVRVYSTENLTAREKPLFPFGIENRGTRETAAASVGVLDKLGVPLCCAPRDMTVTQTAHWMINRLAEDEIDLALFQTGMASPIDWLTARLAPIAVKAGIHIGSSPFNKGFDFYFFDNPMNIEREKDYWTEEMGQRIVLNSGVDIEALTASPVLPRSELGIPEQMVLIGTVSNHLGERLTEEYLDALIPVMLACPDTFFAGFGVPPGDRVRNRFAQAGLKGRFIFPGPVAVSSVVLKMLDIFACEFPVGGSESVKEAIACGVPVVAMRAGPGHAESAAANIVGPPFAIERYDLSAYREQLRRWVVNADERKKASRALARRAREQYSLRRYVQQVMAVCRA